MEGTLLGVALTIVVPFGVLGFSSLVRKMGGSAELSRKLVHILLSNWVLLAMAVYRDTWAICVLPAAFVPLNYLSYRKGIFSGIEREENDSLGTVWYALSLFLLCLAGYLLDMPWIAACGMLAMGYGDGLGALVGKRWGKRRFPGAFSAKSLEGMLTVMVFSGISVGVVCAIYASDVGPYFALRAALVCAAPAAAIELFSPRGTDNLSLPVGVSLIVFLVARYPSVWGVFASVSIGLLILLAAYYLRAITVGGLLSAVPLGSAVFIFGGWISFIALVAFFISGSAVSRVGREKKADAQSLHERQGARTAVQVLANGLPALVFAALFRATGREACLLAVLACFAAAAADTFSSEIGMLSKKEPVSILTLKPMRKGLSGGVTALGFGGAAAGALIISVLAVPRFGAAGMIAVILAGVISSAVDSVLGASLQAKYQMSSDENESAAKRVTERGVVNGTPLKLARGLRWITNDVVNFVSVIPCGLALVAIWAAVC